MNNTIPKIPMYRFLMVLTISAAVGLQGWRTLFNNFAVEAANLNGDHIGIIQSVREIPGFLALLAVFVLLLIREHRLSVLSIFFLGIGVAATGFFPSYSGLLITTMIMSFGFHYYETTNQSLTLQYFDQATAPLVFGKQRSYAAGTNIAVGLSIYFFVAAFSDPDSDPNFPPYLYPYFYMVIATIILLTVIWAFFQDPREKNIVRQHKKMIFRKKYWLYYVLTFLAGARRQIFIAFAVFLMVKNFHYTLQEVTILFVINNVINYFLSPLIGKAIILFGERKVLSLEYFSLIFIFLAYAVVETKLAIAILYIFDHIFFNFAIAIRTFFQKVGDPKDIAPTMAVGFTINHIAAVMLPAAGGFLWLIDYRIPFVFGAFLSITSLLAVQFIRVPQKVS